MRGKFLSEEEAKNTSLELGCEGIHKTKINGCHTKTKKNYIFEEIDGKIKNQSKKNP